MRPRKSVAIGGHERVALELSASRPLYSSTMRNRFKITVVLLALTGTAAAQIPDKDAEQIRAEFIRVYTNASDGAAATADSAKLRAYILYPYVQQIRLRRAFAAPATTDWAVIDRDAEALLKAHDKSAVGADLRREWFDSLAQRQQWERLLANYRDVNDARLRCHMLSARLALQKFEGLEALVVTAWSAAADSQSACESAFAWLKSQPAFTPGLIEARARLALKGGNPAFARQIIAMLPESSKPLANSLVTWASLIERPRAAIDAVIAAPDSNVDAAALLDGWSRLTRADANAALQRYAALVRARNLSDEQASRYALELALSLSWSRRSEALTYFAKVRPSELDDRGAEWYARAALWAGDWKLAAQIIDAMSPTLRQLTKWKYWSARVAELRGQEEAARAQYAALLHDDNYYAALSAARVGQHYVPTPEPFALDEQRFQKVVDLDDFVRARELLRMNSFELRNFAYDEWRYGYAKLDGAAKAQAPIVAARWGWYDQAILTASQQGFFDDYALLYPRPYDTAIKGAADIVSLSPSLLYSVLRQESLYRVDALSTAGAQGLMQLLPSTAAYTAKRRPELVKLLREPKNLQNPTTNIYLGAAKFRDMIDRFGGKVPVALAAYNAGPTAAVRWQPTAKKDIDVWIENIPYNETRIYVQRIYWHSVVFGWLATGEGQSTVSWLTTIGGE